MVYYKLYFGGYIKIKKLGYMVPFALKEKGML
jgi:pimeloyl-CoA synthetase